MAITAGPITFFERVENARGSINETSKHAAANSAKAIPRQGGMNPTAEPWNGVANLNKVDASEVNMVS